MLLRPVLLSACLLAAINSYGESQKENALEQTAIVLVKQFSSELKPALKSAMQNGGPEEAIKVCAEKAPEIATRLSNDSSWSIKRVSLKPRNNRNAIADDFEKKVLQQFAEQNRMKTQQPLRYSATVNGQYRYIQAQKVEALCLVCHGSNIDSKTQQALQQYYPEDKAQGYALGDIRGAFSLMKSVNTP